MGCCQQALVNSRALCSHAWVWGVRPTPYACARGGDPHGSVHWCALRRDTCGRSWRRSWGSRARGAGYGDFAAGRLPVDVGPTQRAGQGDVEGDILWVGCLCRRVKGLYPLLPNIPVLKWGNFPLSHACITPRDQWPALPTACPAWGFSRQPLAGSCLPRPSHAQAVGIRAVPGIGLWHGSLGHSSCACGQWHFTGRQTPSLSLQTHADQPVQWAGSGHGLP